MSQLIVVMNAGSGHDDKATAREAIEGVLRESGRPFRILTPAPDAIEKEIDAAVASAGEPGVLVAAGGDGTLNAVATAALAHGWTLGIVPLGTFNFYARELGLPLDPARATQVLLDGVLKAVTPGRVNGHLFLNNASFGLYRKLLEDREELKQKLGRYRLVAAFSAMLTLWRHRRSYKVDLTIDGKAERWKTSMVFFGLNSLQLEKLHLEVAACTTSGRMALLAPRPLSRGKLLWLAIKGAFGHLKEKEELLCRCASRAQLRWPGHHHVRVAVDGESLDCKLPLEIEVMPRALQVLVPRTPEKRE
ncbi:MAG: diacylglycerol kinase family protein [Steroidobacteraceae bacterium]